ncbi:MAG: hypothetical protein WBC96_12865, partial [Thermodesulfobacteriota bacterium]
MKPYQLKLQMMIPAIVLALFAIISCVPKQNEDSQSIQSTDKTAEDRPQDKKVSEIQHPPTSEYYELYPVFKASELLEPELLRGEHHEVVEEVRNDCVWNSYTIKSDFGEYNARNTSILEIRVKEINATAKLQETSGGQALAVGASDSVINPFRSAINIATNP